MEWWYGNLKGRSFKENSTTERIEEVGEEEDEESKEESTTNDKNCGVQLSGVCVVQVIHLNMRFILSTGEQRGVPTIVKRSSTL